MENPISAGNAKSDAFRFLTGLHRHLTRAIPARDEMIALMTRLSNDPANPHRIRENIFLYEILKILHVHLVDECKLTDADARHALRCEYYAKFPDISTANAFRKSGYPFSKKILSTTADIYAQWTKPDRALPINQAFPDFTLSSPLPHQIVFDAKYFTSEATSQAQAALVSGVYESAFYRGLPKDDATAWAYDYGCLIAYDASESRSLHAAWNAVTCKDVFWSGANVYVMIL